MYTNAANNYSSGERLTVFEGEGVHDTLLHNIDAVESRHQPFAGAPGGRRGT